MFTTIPKSFILLVFGEVFLFFSFNCVSTAPSSFIPFLADQFVDLAQETLYIVLWALLNVFSAIMLAIFQVLQTYCAFKSQLSSS